ncbi:unnamed protein product [Pieris brassicae]|uniref:Uncharacterized protein n=1 Tax=Pieris brassicae TaxID=7116 RepID=A0A9P0TR08_PIEBR|nr:unnamed protein product [Pieris brassicae]
MDRTALSRRITCARSGVAKRASNRYESATGPRVFLSAYRYTSVRGLVRPAAVTDRYGDRSTSALAWAAQLAPNL